MSCDFDTINCGADCFFESTPPPYTHAQTLLPTLIGGEIDLIEDETKSAEIARVGLPRLVMQLKEIALGDRAKLDAPFGEPEIDEIVERHIDAYRSRFEEGIGTADQLLACVVCRYALYCAEK